MAGQARRSSAACRPCRSWPARCYWSRRAPWC
jgi:hypothetical protein